MDRQLINSARLILSVTRKGMYVRVYGHLKAFQDKRSLNAYSLRYRFNLFFFFLMFELNHMKNIKVSIYLLVAVLSICFMLSILCMQQYSFICCSLITFFENVKSSFVEVKVVHANESHLLFSMQFS